MIDMTHRAHIRMRLVALELLSGHDVISWSFLETGTDA
jgi:hypothetical protein